MRYQLLRGDAARIPLPSKSVDLVIGSPPYTSARLYLEGGRDLGIVRGCVAWVAWMLAVTTEALRVSRGPVLWVVAGKTEDWCYQPAPEGLLWEWWRRGGECHCFRPAYWHRYGIPGSGQKQWYRADVEYVLCFKRPGRLPYADPTANGHPPKFGPGGEMSHRTTNGGRRNQWGGTPQSTGMRRANGKRRDHGRPSHSYPDATGDEPDFLLSPDAPEPSGPDINQWGGHATTGRSREADGTQQAPGRPSHRYTIEHTKRNPDGSMGAQVYEPPVLADPGNLIHTGTGGGQLGHRLAYASEAPYPIDVPAFFVRSHCPPGGLVLDPFSGSGTTAHAALIEGRRCIGMDLRQSQCRLARRRLRSVTPGFAFGPLDSEMPS